MSNRIEEGENCEVPGATDGHLEVGVDGACLDEVLVDLGFVEAADYGPDDFSRGVDALGEEGRASPLPHRVAVELLDG